MAIQRKGANRIQRAIDKREPFKQASMSGRFLTEVKEEHGQLSDVWVPELNHAITYRLPVYVIYSYETPIAWHAAGSWTIPAEHYSHTTTTHQGIVRVAVGSSVAA